VGRASQKFNGRIQLSILIMELAFVLDEASTTGSRHPDLVLTVSVGKRANHQDQEKA
jgi:hypothetical protein